MSSERIFWPPSCRLLADYAPGMQLGIAEANPCPWWWTVSGSKMSKSSGETVDPLNLAERYGAGCVRYFVMREMTVGNDANSPSNDLNPDRAVWETTGNLVSRLLHMTAAYEEGIVPAVELEDEPKKIKSWHHQRVRLGLFFRLSVQPRLGQNLRFQEESTSMRTKGRLEIGQIRGSRRSSGSAHLFGRDDRVSSSGERAACRCHAGGS